MLEEKANETVENNQVQDTSLGYIETIKELKRNSVPKADYDKVLEENKTLLKSIVNGEQIDVPTEQKPKQSISEIRKNVLHKSEGMTNLEYVTNVLELRDALIKEGKPDPFVPIGHRYQTKVNDIENAERVANVLQHCVDTADGNPDVFNAELKRLTKNR